MICGIAWPADWLSREGLNFATDAFWNVAIGQDVQWQIIGTKTEPGWGARNVDALKERVHLLVDEEKYTEAYVQANGLVKQLAKPVLAHRLLTRSHRHGERASESEAVMDEIIDQTPLPG